ncbi:hypothetical protein MRB53_039024 [Persea americana]|nr:hypothetical protein MRB53_039024 [Persea americana]
MKSSMTNPQNAIFEQKKQAILTQLDTPLQDYKDLSPKGSVDVEIKDLIAEINGQDGLVTTSSCAGRIAVFLDGSQTRNTGHEQAEDVLNESAALVQGGKGGDGRWLYVSHAPLTEQGGELAEPSLSERFGLNAAAQPVCMKEFSRLVHFKFEPMILHILASDLDKAKKVLAAAQQAGFRESGVSSLSHTPMVAVRSTGLAFDSIIGVLACGADEDEHPQAIVNEEYLRFVTSIANARFAVNKSRIDRFQHMLARNNRLDDKPDWEDSESRRQRKAAEGRKMQQATFWLFYTRQKHQARARANGRRTETPTLFPKVASSRPHISSTSKHQSQASARQQASWPAFYFVNGMRWLVVLPLITRQRLPRIVNCSFSLFNKQSQRQLCRSTSRMKEKPPQNNIAPKYCQNCGRLISPNHRNFAERKYCSKTCSGTRLDHLDHELENMFVLLAKSKGSVECGEVESMYADHHRGGEEVGNEDKQKQGMQNAVWRERVRRAARRVVVFGAGEDKFECVQQGKLVEPSFAKGEWSVRIKNA